jgi:hypothetical protein
MATIAPGLREFAEFVANPDATLYMVMPNGKIFELTGALYAALPLSIVCRVEVRRTYVAALKLSASKRRKKMGQS